MASKKQSREIPVLEQKLRDNPRSRVFSRLANMYREDGDLQAAITLCLAGLAEHPNYVTARLVLGRCYKEQKNLPAAIDELTKVCAGDERNHAALRMLAEIYLAQGRAEIAGSLYGILANMEPDNPEIRQAAIRNRQRLKGGVRELLGIRPAASADSPVRSPAVPGLNPFENMRNLDAIQGTPTVAVHVDAGQAAVTGNDVESQLDSMFGGHTVTLKAESVMGTATVHADSPTGSDVESHLDSIFGTQTVSISPESIRGGATVAHVDSPTGSDIENHLDSIFGTQTVSISPESLRGGAAAVQVDSPTGSDIENQLDSIFGVQAASMPVSGQAHVQDLVTGSDIENQLDSIFGEQFAAAPAPGQEVVTGSDVENQLDSIFGAQFAAVPAPAAARDEAVQELTGNDIEMQLDALFGGAAIAAPSMNAAPAVSLPEPQELRNLTGSDIENHLDALFGIAKPSVGESRGEEVLIFGAGEPPAPAFAAEGPSIGISGDSSELFADESSIRVSDESQSLFADGPAIRISGESTSLFDDEPPAPAAKPVAVAIDEGPGNLFDFGAEETIQFGRDEIGRADDGFPVIGLVPPPTRPESALDGFSAESDEAPSFMKSDIGVGETPSVFKDGPGSININLDDSRPFPSGGPGSLSVQLDDGPPLIRNELGGVDNENYDGSPSLLKSFYEATVGEDEAAIGVIERLGSPAAGQATAGTGDEVSGDDIEARLSELFGAQGFDMETSGEENAGQPADVDDDVLEDIGAESITSILSFADEESGEDIIDEDRFGGEILHSSDLIGELADETLSFGAVNTIEALAGGNGEVSAASVFDDGGGIGAISTMSGLDDDDGIGAISTMSGLDDGDSIGAIGNISSLNDDGVKGDVSAISGMDGSIDEPAPTFDDVQDKIRQLFKSESSEDDSIDIGLSDDISESVFDERDAPFDLPDHVLTSTLADIYYQQGQPQLALHIYERLALRSPGDTKLLERMDEIRDTLLHAEASGTFVRGGSAAVQPEVAAPKRKKKGTGAVKDDKRPLAGVRIKKGGGPAKKSSRGKS